MTALREYVHTVLGCASRAGDKFEGCVPDSPKLVGVLVETDDTWGRNVVEAIARYARAADWDLLICPRDAQRRLRLPPRWGGDGVIVLLRDVGTARHVRNAKVPAVDISTTMSQETWLGRVATDDRQRARLAFDHLRERGFERFACYAPPLGRYSDHRAQHFVDIANEAGFSCDRFAPTAKATQAGWHAEYQDARAWLAGLEKPVAVFAADPYPARQLAEICNRAGVRLPDEVALIAGDTDDLLCSVAWPQITSVELASRQIGDRACVTLARLMAGAPVDPEPTLVPPVRVLARHSTDILAIDDQELAEILRTIRTRALSGLDVRDLLAEFPISRRGLEMKFRRNLGRTPADEIRRVRLEEACRLLIDTDRSIDSVAAAVGMSGGPALSHAFRKHFGLTPGEVRNGRLR